MPRYTNVVNVSQVGFQVTLPFESRSAPRLAAIMPNNIDSMNKGLVLF
jgi:hypothetical protein